MHRIRVALVTAIVLLVLAAVPMPAGAQTPVDFGTTQLGEVKTHCGAACFGMNCSSGGTVSNIVVNPPFYVRGIRVGPASSPDLCNNTPNVTTPATLPVALDPGEAIVFDVDLIPLNLGNFGSLLTVNTSTLFDYDATVVPVNDCTPGTATSCLADDRFQVRLKWRTSFGTRGPAPLVPVPSDNSGLFYFFNSDNWEMLLKVLRGCPINTHFWVFAAATTNVEFTLTVVDTDTQATKAYFNPLGNPAPPIQDTQAFATCP